ncbi:MAG: hypothetical protein M3O61_14965 [Gemmatimonadota bacterium]|nr:hypothetical protein [Gemmatimonadota bacterium]
MPGPRPGQSHLWIVLSDPHPETQKVLAVMVVSEKPTTDHTITLNVGDHPFFVRASNVDYRTTYPFPVSKLAAVIASPTGILREDVSAEILIAVRKGAFVSTRTPHDIRAMCAERFSEVDGTDLDPPA